MMKFALSKKSVFIQIRQIKDYYQKKLCFILEPGSAPIYIWFDHNIPHEK